MVSPVSSSVSVMARSRALLPVVAEPPGKFVHEAVRRSSGTTESRTRTMIVSSMVAPRRYRAMTEMSGSGDDNLIGFDPVLGLHVHADVECPVDQRCLARPGAKGPHLPRAEHQQFPAAVWAEYQR